MADSEKRCHSESFQEWFPLKIVEQGRIPSHDKIIDFDEKEIGFFINLSVNMQVLCTAENGVGLSAVQCGLPFNFFIASHDGKTFRTFANCLYSSEEEKLDSLEGCLSIKNSSGKLRRFILKRFPKIRLIGLEIFTNDPIRPVREINEEFSGLFAVVLQHEIDHNKGILISDIGKEVEVYN